MSFTSYEFLAFLAILFPVYYLLPGKLRPWLLLLSNLVFYSFAGAAGLAFMSVTVVCSWAGVNLLGKNFARQKSFLKSEEGKTLSREEKKAYKQKMAGQRKLVLVFTLVIDLGILAVLKYSNFALSVVGSGIRTDWVLPMGISFYTFQTVGYVIDVYWEKVEPEKNLLKSALFTSFFPLLIQGPICRFSELAETLFSPRPFNGKETAFGLQRMVWGYFKKLVVADRLLPAVQAICGNPDAMTGAYAFFGAVFYAAELYADFTGGIDITIGIAQVLGITVQENFRRPFFSRNIAEYWRRWHISMGTWFKDYIFYPISVSPRLLSLTKRLKQKGHEKLARKVSVYTATLVTWFVTGLWHGAAWNFIVWGMLNGVLILISEEIKPVTSAFREKNPKLVASAPYALFEMLRTFLLMCSFRMLDCYRNVGVTFRAFGSIFTEGKWKEALSGGLLELGLTRADYLVVIAGVLLMVLVSAGEEKHGDIRTALSKKPALSAAVFLTLFLAVLVFGAYGIGYDSTSFIYNQF